jgi:hypothetical protein
MDGNGSLFGTLQVRFGAILRVLWCFGGFLTLFMVFLGVFDPFYGVFGTFLCVLWCF